ncbi:MAG: HD domain-containing protein [Acidimicrobiia bacterium]
MSSDRGGDATVLGPRFVRAVEWASSLHATHRRKGTDAPYLSHPLAVAALVLEAGGTETEAIAALLHDVIEDASVKPKKIRRRFGRKVTRIVVACTETLDGDLPTSKSSKKSKKRDSSTWRARKEHTVAQLGDPATPAPVLRVKAADSLSNARSIVADLRRTGPETWQRFNAGAIDQLWYYRSLAVVLAHRLPGALTDELRATVREMEQLAGWWFAVGDPQPGKPT